MKAKKPAPKKADAIDHTLRLKKILGFVIAGFAFLLYAQSISFDYAADDGSVIAENSVTTQGLKGIPTILQKDYWYGTGNYFRPAQYRPTSLITYAVEWEFFPRNPHVSHFVNVVLFALTCWLLFLLLCRMFGNNNILLPLICCLLSAAHPIHTEVVNNIKSRDEIFCFLFAIASMIFALKWLKENKIYLLVLSAIFFFLSILSKETGIAFLVVMPLMFYFFTQAKRRHYIVMIIALAASTALMFLIRSQVFAGMKFNETMPALNNSLSAAPDFISQKATAVFILLRYILLLIFPHPLSYDYSIAQIPNLGLKDIEALAAIILIAAIGIYALISTPKKKVPAFAILFFLLTIAPVSNLLILIGAPMAERFLYMPSLGFCLLLAFLLARIFKTNLTEPYSGSFKKIVSANALLFTVVVAACGLLSLKTLSRNPDWKNDITLFSHDVANADKSARAHYNWGTVLLQQVYPAEKDAQKKNQLLDSARAELEKAVAIYPDYPDAWLNIGLIAKNKGDFKKGIESFLTAKNYSPKPRAELFFDLGDMYLQDGQLEKSIKAFDEGLAMHSAVFADVYITKGVAQFRLKRFEDAIVSFKAAIQLDASSALAYKNAGLAYINLKDYTNAVQYFVKATSLDPSDVKTLQDISSIYRFLGDTANARVFAEKVKGKR